MLATGAAVVLVALVGLWLTQPKPGAAYLYGQLIPRWQIFRAEELRRTDSPAARAMLAAAQGWPALAEQLRELDRAYPDDALAAVARVNGAARAAGVPYWLEVQTIRGRPVLLSHKVERIRHWRAGKRQIEVLYLRRQDPLNIEMGLIGQASSNGPLVFLDRIEDEWAEDLAHVLDPKSDAIVNQAGRKLMADQARAQIGEVLIDLARDLGQRRERFAAMQGRMKVVVPQPTGLVWSERWFARIETLTKFERGRGPLVFASDLREVRKANEALQRPAYTTTMAALVDVVAQGVEAHEARHALDAADPPLPAFLRAWGNQDFAAQINHELRAYLGELYDAPQGACFGVVSLARVAFAPKARLTPHFFAGRIIAYGLQGNILPAVEASQGADGLRAVLDSAISGINPVAFMRGECAAAANDRRARVAKLWQQLYGEVMPEVERDRDERLSLAAEPR